jgi:CRP-like cAMP-binding protein
MSGRDAFKPCSETCVVSRNGEHALSAQHSPRQNRLLAALPPEDFERLLPYLKPVSLPIGWTVHRAGEPQAHLFFLATGIVCRFYLMENGASARLAVTGNEGVVGVSSFLGGGSTPSEAVVLSAGYAYRVATHVLKHEFAHEGRLPQLLFRYTMALIAQTAQIAVCNRHHTLQQQLCRWLLLGLDRMPSNELSMTQELIAAMLGVRRESITEAAGRLQAMGLIHYSRGHICVLDRPRLEAEACECYAVVKREYDRLLPIDNVTGNADVHASDGHDRCSISRNQSRLSAGQTSYAADAA